MDNEKEISGKIAFMFPAKFNLEGARAPTLNFTVRDDGVIAMSVGISFLELKNTLPYFVSLKLADPNLQDVPISSSMDAIPENYIDPVKRSSFLTASFYFNPTLNGTYRFTCELLNPYDSENPLDSMSVFFNVLGVV